jgi:hypothetical protein
VARHAIAVSLQHARGESDQYFIIIHVHDVTIHDAADPP